MTAPHISPEQLLEHQDWLFRLVRNLAKDDFSADDMVQATMAEALADENAGQTNLRAWLGSTARRLTAQNWRSEYRRQQRQGKVALSDETVLQQSSDITELFHVANQALRDLPENERVVIMLRHMQGWKSQRVADELKIPLDKVYRDSERGLKKLRDRFQAKYGKEWNASCLAILGIPLGRGTAATLGTVAAIAASLAVLLGGAWLGGLFDGSEVRKNESQTANRALVAQTSSHIDALPLHQNGVRRETLPPPSNSQAAYSMHAVDELGNSLSGVEVSFSFHDLSTYMFSAKKVEFTDSAGMAYFQLEPGQEPEGVMATANGLFHQLLIRPNVSLGTPTTLRFWKGTIPVSFQLINGPPNAKLLVRGETGARAFCVTDQNGFGTLLLPHPGKYQVMPAKALPRMEIVNFQALAGGSESPIQVSYPSPKEFTLTAVQAGSGEVITTAEFTLVWPTMDENSHTAESKSLPLQGEQGVLWHRVQEMESPYARVRVHADGYSGIQVAVVEALEAPFVVELQPLTQVRASFQLSDPRRHLVSAKATYANAKFDLTKEGPESTLLLWENAPVEDLFFTNRNQVLISKTEAGDSLGLYCTAVDDLGQAWHSAILGASDLHGHEPQILLTHLPQESTTLKFLHAPSPDSSYTYSVALPFFPGRASGLLALSEEREAEIATNPGERLTASFRDARFFCDLALTLPTTPGAPTYSIQFPERTATLHGRITDALGQPLMDCSVTAIPKQQTMATGSSPVEIVKTGFNLKIHNGLLHEELLFEGEYELKFWYPGHTFYRTVSTENDFALVAPTLVQYQFRVMDRDSQAPLAGVLNRRRDLGLSLPMIVERGDPTTGHLVTSVDTAEATDGLFIVAKGYQPDLLSNYIHGSPQVVELTPGRNGSIVFSENTLDCNPQAHWTLDAWGEDSDPRHSLLRNFLERVSFEGAPLEDFILIEREADGTQTGRTIEVLADGSILVHIS